MKQVDDLIRHLLVMDFGKPAKVSCRVGLKVLSRRPLLLGAAWFLSVQFGTGGIPEDLQSLRLAIDDLVSSYGSRYSRGKEFAERLTELEHREAASGSTREFADALARLRNEALQANPLLDFNGLLLVERDEKNPGLPQNWEGNSSLRRDGFDNRIAVLSPVRPEGELRTLFKPDGGRFVGDVDLDFDGRRMLFSMPGSNGRWQVFEMPADGGNPQPLPLIGEPDVDNYDACYLPDGNIVFSSTAPFTGVPCVQGSSQVANLYRFDRGTGAIRRLTFDQDHNWCPAVLNDGRLLYLRWEYSDLPHFVSRILFRMNPDGTDQKEFYGSGSYWPNAMFYGRPIPGSATKFVAVVGGHHGQPRTGELALFDTAKGRFEAEGAIQRIPGRGRKVEPVILDQLSDASWPKFLHPWPLSDKYFIVSCKPAPGSKWGIYLADVFDNLVLLKEAPDGRSLLEPIPFRPVARPPVVPSKVQAGQDEALVNILDLYSGPGLEGVPRGTVKQLRLFTYHFAYHHMGGQINRIGLDGPWDIKRVMGTVPVEEDGSAFFRVPANTPISVQPLDADGQALQLMRSWMTAMPGETLSCTGCHDRQNSAPPAAGTSLALSKPPAIITPWRGPVRGFSFVREVQPVLDRFCVSCHGGKPGGGEDPDFRAAPPEHPKAGDPAYNNGTRFTPSYLALRSYVRGHSMESDMHLLTPCEFAADTTELMQMLRSGHHGVKLDAEAWDRLTTWIDLNTPAHGTWTEIVGAGKVTAQRDRRREMLKRFAGRDEDPEEILAGPAAVIAADSPVRPPAPLVPAAIKLEGWPFDAAEARRKQGENGVFERQIDLGNGVKLDWVLIPKGKFIQEDSNGAPGQTSVTIGEPFWMGRFEISNEQYALFDPTHDSRIERGDLFQFSANERGYPANGARQPVVRVSWNQAMEFCHWLSEKTGRHCTLPSEAQWEYACRAGTATPLWFGTAGTEFSKFANLADRSLRVMPTLSWGLPSGAVPPWRPAIESINDTFRVSSPIGSFEPNPWGLFDTCGNVWEWTAGDYGPGRKAVRGGSWWVRPFRATSASRLGYRPWQRVYDVGFRVVMTP